MRGRCGAYFVQTILTLAARQKQDPTVDPKLLTTYLTAVNSWQIKEETYRIKFGQASDSFA